MYITLLSYKLLRYMLRHTIDCGPEIEGELCATPLSSFIGHFNFLPRTYRASPLITALITANDWFSFKIKLSLYLDYIY